MILPDWVDDDVSFRESEISWRKRVVERVADGHWESGCDVEEGDC